MLTLLDSLMDKYSTEILVTLKNGILSSYIFEKKEDNTIKCVCEKENEEFWFKKYSNIISKLDMNTSLYIYMNPFYNIYEGLIVINYENYYEIMYDIKGDSLTDCLKNLDSKIAYQRRKIRR